MFSVFSVVKMVLWFEECFLNHGEHGEHGGDFGREWFWFFVIFCDFLGLMGWWFVLWFSSRLRARFWVFVFGLTRRREGAKKKRCFGRELFSFFCVFCDFLGVNGLWFRFLGRFFVYTCGGG